MTFNYDECRTLLHAALVSVLHERGDKIRDLHRSEDIWALSYDVIPWQPFAALSFRVREESQGDLRYDVAGWRHYEFVGDIDAPALKQVAEYVAAEVNGPTDDDADGTRSQETAHLIYLAAAEALLAEDVATFLKSLGINAPATSDTLRLSYFEFIVFDDDKALKANYCELLRANQITQRLLGWTV